MFTKSQIDLFWKNVDRQGVNDCWNWKLSTDRYGYGKVKIGGKIYISHRIAFEILNPNFDKKKQILHVCDNPLCCNPRHLYTGTIFDNARDRILRNRQAKLKNNPRKLTRQNAETIRTLFIIGKSKRELARMYNINPVHVRDIIKRRYWK